MSKNTGYITVLNVDGHKHTRRAGFHNPCGFVTDLLCITRNVEIKDRTSWQIYVCAQLY